MAYEPLEIGMGMQDTYGSTDDITDTSLELAEMGEGASASEGLIGEDGNGVFRSIPMPNHGDDVCEGTATFMFAFAFALGWVTPSRSRLPPPPPPASPWPPT